MIVFLVLICFILWVPATHSIFTDFDLVRPRIDAWGSEGIRPYVLIDAATNNGPNCSASALFGSSVAVIGDIDGNGIDDVVVGATGEMANSGGIYIMLMSHNGSVLSSVHISSQINGGPELNVGDEFGYAVAALGDLDGDGVPDIAVSAPAIVLSSVYVFYLHGNGSVRESVLIRGEYQGVLNLNTTAPVVSPTRNPTRSPTRIPTSSSSSSPSAIPSRQPAMDPTSQPSTQPTSQPTSLPYTPNGPPLSYGSRFGTAMTAVGDLDGDGVTELCVSSVDRGGGRSRIYILYMFANSTVKHYTYFAPGGIGGGPYIPTAFSGFGSALLTLPDFDGDNVSEVVVGARFMFDAGSVNRRAGKSYVCFLNANGTVKRTTELGELSLPGQPMPSVPLDECGTSLATIGDINKDNYRQRRPTELAYPLRPSVPDFISGCPQSATGTLPGRFFLMFLTPLGEMAGFKDIPGYTDVEGQGGGKNPGPRVAPPLYPSDQFAQSLAGYIDLDNNGLREILVGAPGHDVDFGNGNTTRDAGAVYIMFLRRRRFHWIPFDIVSYVLMIAIPCTCFLFSCIGGTIYFFWYFRRRPDEVEIIVKKSGYEMKKERQRYQKANNQIYADNYTA